MRLRYPSASVFQLMQYFIGGRSFVKVGAMVFLCHDINDIFLEACKMARYAEHRCARQPSRHGGVVHLHCVCWLGFGCAGCLATKGRHQLAQCCCVFVIGLCTGVGGPLPAAVPSLAEVIASGYRRTFLLALSVVCVANTHPAFTYCCIFFFSVY